MRIAQVLCTAQGIFLAALQTARTIGTWCETCAILKNTIPISPADDYTMRRHSGQEGAYHVQVFPTM